MRNSPKAMEDAAQAAAVAPPLARTIQETCRALGISRATVYRLANSNRLRLVRIAGRTVCPETEIVRLANEGT